MATHLERGASAPPNDDPLPPRQHSDAERRALVAHFLDAMRAALCSGYRPGFVLAAVSEAAATFTAEATRCGSGAE